MRPFEAADHRAVYFYFHFNPTATTAIYTLSLHDALPIFHLIGRANAGDSEDRVRTRVHECDERIHHPAEEVQRVRAPERESERARHGKAPGGELADDDAPVGDAAERQRAGHDLEKRPGQP